MSKYQILTNTDCNNDGSTTTTATTTTATLTDDDDENYGIFYRNDNNDQLRLNNNHHHSNNIQRQQHNHQHHHYNNHYFDDDDDFHHNDIHPHRESLSSTGNHVEDLIQYNNDDDSSTIISDTKQSVNNNSNTNTTGKVIIMNGNRNHNNNNTSNIKTNTNNLMAELNAAEANDSTMEIPLLHQDHHHHHQNNNSNGMNYNKQLDFEYVCLCQQKGFASNLNNNSTQTAKSKILWAIALCCIFMIVEFLGGYIAGSLAIMTDAAHLASDCISFVIGLVAIWLGSRPPDAKMSFGYKRLEVMGAIVSILGIWILTATLVLVAIQRIYSNDYDLDANTMMTISGIGILINIIMIFILHTSVLDLPAGSIGSSHGHSHNHSHHGHSHSHSSPSLHRRRRHSNNDGNHLHSELSSRSLVTTASDATADAAVVDSGEATSIELSSAPLVLNGNDFKHQQDGKEKNLNLRAAMIHVIGDLVQSFGVFIASILIKIYPKAVFLDPLCTLLFSVIVVMTTINLFKESMHLIMDSVPQGLSIDNLEMDLLDIEGIKSVHHLNVWNHTSNHSILMVHLVIDFLADSNTVLLKATQLAASVKYNIKHSTIQIERVTT